MQKDFEQKPKDLNQFQIQNPFFPKGLQILSNIAKLELQSLGDSYIYNSI